MSSVFWTSGCLGCRHQISVVFIPEVLPITTKIILKIIDAGKAYNQIGPKDDLGFTQRSRNNSISHSAAWHPCAGSSGWWSHCSLHTHQFNATLQSPRDFHYASGMLCSPDEIPVLTPNHWLAFDRVELPLDSDSLLIPSLTEMTSSDTWDALLWGCGGPQMT